MATLDERALRIRQLREAAAKFGRAAKKGDCGAAQKHKSAYLKALGRLDEVSVRTDRTWQKFDDGASRMDAVMARCKRRRGY